MARPGWLTSLGLSRMTASLDHVYAAVVHKLSASTFFSAGWGPVSNLHLPSVCAALEALHARHLGVTWRAASRGVHRGTAYEVLEGSFESPGATGWLLGLPPESERGRVWLMRPLSLQRGPTGMSGCWLQLPATGEHSPKYALLPPSLANSSWLCTLDVVAPRVCVRERVCTRLCCCLRLARRHRRVLPSRSLLAARVPCLCEACAVCVKHAPRQSGLALDRVC